MPQFYPPLPPKTMFRKIKEEVSDVLRGLISMLVFVASGIAILFLAGVAFGFFICGARIFGGF